MKIKIVMLIVSIILFAGIAAGLYYAGKILRTPNAEVKENTLIEIEKGASTKSVAEYLYGHNLIKDKIAYIYSTKFFGKKINSGFYEIPAGSSIAEIINIIDSGKIKLIKVTIPEGWRTEQIAQKLNQEKILSYADFISEGKSLEGKLFPDTYFMNPRMTATEVIKMMTDDYERRTAGLTVSFDDLALASIIEREASKDSERAVIAGVYVNRLERNMKLEADPTVQYGKDTLNLAKASADEQINFKFWQSVGFADYQGVKSEFNTYRIAGLPPLPICNPGIKSIEAALSPASHNYLYFLQHDGEIYPSKTLAEHDANRRMILGQN